MTGQNKHQRTLETLQRRVVACTRCARLIRHCRKVAKEKRRMFRNEAYWGKPVPSFGDPEAELLIVGLAPAAHGANRTGRMFAGDRSGEFLYRALHEAGFANQPASVRRGDGLELHNCYITAALRCAPPANKPLLRELLNCRPYLLRELELLPRLRAVLALGKIGFDAYLRAVREGRDLPPLSAFRFAHGASYDLADGLPRLFASYHPSQQNTQTGRLTPAMFREVFRDIRAFLARGSDGRRQDEGAA